MRFWIISYGSGFFTVGPSLQLPVVDTPFHGLRDNAGGPGVCFFFWPAVVQNDVVFGRLHDSRPLFDSRRYFSISYSSGHLFFFFFFSFSKNKKVQFFLFLVHYFNTNYLFIYLFFLKFTFSFTKIKGDKKNYMMSIKTHIVVVC